VTAKIATASWTMSQTRSRRDATVVLLVIATAVLAAGVFIVDTITTYDIAVGPLYIVVVLIAARFCTARDLVFVGAGCVALLSLSYLLSPPLVPSDEALLNVALRSVGIAVATFLAVQSQLAQTAGREKENLLDLTHDTIFVRTVDDAITYWNRGAEERYGWTRDEAIGKISHELMQTIFLAPLEEINAQLLSTGRWEGELIHTKRDGSRVTVSSRWSLERDEHGRPAAILETNNDVTERKRAEILTARVFESSPNGMSIIGRDYRYQRVNPVYERDWGIPADRIVGMHVSALVGKDFFERTSRPYLERCFAGEEVAYAEWFGDSRGRRYLAVTYAPLRPDSERVEAVLVIAHDLTEHVRASEALRAAQAELAHVVRMSTLGELAASIAHEINQPLAGIITSASAGLRWLDAESPKLVAARDALGRIQNDGKRAADVISRIRALASKSPIRMDLLSINEVILDVIALMGSEMDHNRIEFRTALAEDLPAIRGDKVHLQQVILNLIVNAIEAMQDGDQRKLVIGSSKDDAQSVVVSVSDSGSGLDPANIDRVFDSFYTTKPSGMGMGLSICRSIIEAHGGRLTARANMPRGAVFEFALPRDQGDPPAA
jgi:PAS domain S-box-containing protein